MEKNDIVALAFLILGGGFTIGVVWSMINLISYEWKSDQNNFKQITTLFKIPIIFFFLIMVFLIGVLPRLN